MIPFPLRRTPAEQVLDRMQEVREQDVLWREGRVFSLVFFAGEDVLDLIKKAYALFISENGLNPAAFPSLRRFESDVVGIAASLLGGDAKTAGTMTSGGTESILMAVKAARDWARVERPGIAVPEMVLPVSAHPAFHKAGHYFGVRPVVIPVAPDYRADVEVTEAVITKSTILLVGSAPAYPYGVVDPIAELGKLAERRGLLCHVDACVGGFFLPFVRRLGYPVPEFDLSVPGVTSLSADLHKYAYSAKGASVILYRTRALRRYQFHVHLDWPGGIYASPSMTGTRPGGAIAAAWAVLHHLGEEGYLALASQVMGTVSRLREGIEAIPGLAVLGEPVGSILAITSGAVDVYEIGVEMGLRGWRLDRQQRPPSLHMTVTPAHVQGVEPFLDDLRQATEAVARAGPAGERCQEAVRRPAMYGITGDLMGAGSQKQAILDLMDRMLEPSE
ncbi:MAG TPA: aspartate aminotransferase family protein [Anaerolineae bacterium]|nr:aspartate aminotransferase family protein [Anaerolineae bacterium]